MQDYNPALSCNSCHSHVDGIAYRTACLHLLCPTCAKSCFANGQTCTICRTVLSKGDVKEAVIGVSAQVDIDDALFQMAFSTVNYSDMIENLNRMRQAFAQLENFVSTQLLLETSQHQVSTFKALDDNINLKIELTSINDVFRENEESLLRYQQEAESALKSRDKEMSELKDAYKEKYRKCQAWEKAYKNIRDQVVASSSRDYNSQEIKAPTAEHSASVSSSLNSSTQDQRRVLPQPNYQGRDLNSQQSAGTRPDNYIERRQQPAHMSPPGAYVPENQTRALRRTEVTTYSKSFVPDGQYRDHRISNAHTAPQQRLERQQHGDRTVVPAKLSYGALPRQYPPYSSPPIEQLMIPFPSNNVRELYRPQQRDQLALPDGGYKKRSRSPAKRDPSLRGEKSSFFD